MEERRSQTNTPEHHIPEQSTQPSAQADAASDAPAQSEVQEQDVDNGVAQLEADLAEFQVRLGQLEQESANYKDSYLRATADLKNFKRRTEEERSNLIRNATAGLIMKLLPVLDDFDLAMQHVPAEVAETPWFGGLEGIYRKLQVILEGEGVKPIDALGQPFDPHFHEAVAHEDAGTERSGKVTAELRRGYTLHDRVLRPSMVKVGE